MSIAVTGATGALGTLVINDLVGRVPASEVVALARNTEKAAPLADLGVAVRAFDYSSDVDTLAAALEGVTDLLLISGSEVGQRFTQHKAVIDAAQQAGVGRLVYTSVLNATESTVPVAPEHVSTEQYLAETGLNHVILRNGWYNENYLGELQQAPATGAILSSAGDGRIASASRADYAEAAAAVLTSAEAKPRYELSGDVAWTTAELAAVLTEATGTPIAVNQVTPEQHAEILTGAGLDQNLVGFLVDLDASIAKGELGSTTGELSSLIGHPTTPLAVSLKSAAQG